MIDERELRIGNKILHKGKVETISRVEQDSFCTDEYGHGVFDADIEPLLFTPEILEKCGFELYDSDYDEDDFIFQSFRKWIGTTVYISIGTTPHEGWEMGVSRQSKEPERLIDIDADGIVFGHIHHLHQLQNLYFVLTGKELEINL